MDLICAFSGHRPQRLPWGDREEDVRCVAVKQMIARRLQEAWNMGCRIFLCGMALGCDMYFAEAVLALRQEHPEVRLIAVIPWQGQSAQWNRSHRERYKRLCDACDQTEVLEPYYTKGCALRRNREMIARAQVLISVYDGGPGGTEYTVDLAKERGLTILPVWL